MNFQFVSESLATSRFIIPLCSALLIGAGIIFLFEATAIGTTSVFFGNITTIMLLAGIVFIVAGSVLWLHGNLNVRNARQKNTTASIAVDNEFFLKIFDSNSVPSVLTVLPERTVVRVNKVFEEVFGFTAEEVTGKLVTDIDTWAESSERLCAAQLLLQNGRVRNYGFEFKTKEGKSGYGVYNAELIELQRIKCVLTQIIDITEQKKSEIRLQKTEAQYRALTEQIPAIIYRTPIGNHTEFTFISPQIAALGFTPEEWVSDPQFLQKQLHPDDLQRLESEYERVFSSTGQIHYEYRLQSRDGEYHWFRDDAVIIRDETGNPLYFQGVMIEITEQRQTLAAMQHSNTAYAALLQNITGAVYRCRNDKDWTVTFISEGCAAILGYTPDEIVENRVITLGALIHPDDADHIWEKCQLNLANNMLCDNEYRIIARNGELRWVRDQAQGRYSEDGSLMYIEGLITDITEHKYFESLILQERSMLEHIAANSSLPELLTNLTNTHESLFPRTMCSVLLLDASGKYLTHGAAPSLPDAYLNDINGIAIGPSVGSCGTAAYTGEIVIVSDIETDPLWSNYRQFASKHNLRACWSVPIKSAEGAVLGTFALYYHEPRSPLQHELTAIISSARLAGIAIERKRAEETLRRTQKEYEALLNTIDGIVWEADARNFQYSYVSKQTERLLGYPAAKWLDEPTFWKDHIYSEDQNWAVNYRVDCTRKLEDHEFEYRMITADGSIVWLRDIVSVIVEKDQPVTLRGIMVDITSRKTAELAKAKSDELYRNLFNTMEEGLVINEAVYNESGEIIDHIILEVNPAFENQSPYTINDALGNRASVLYGFSIEFIHDWWKNYLQSSNPQQIEFFHEPTGHWFLITHTLPVNGRFATFFYNISTRKQAEIALRYSEEQFRLIAENTPDLITILGTDGRLLYNSPAYKTMFGEPEFKNTTDVFAIIHHDDRAQAFAAVMEIASGAVANARMEIRLLAADGSLKYVESSGSAIRDQDGNIIQIIIVSRDVTEKKRIEEQLLRTQRMESIGTLAGGIAHDLNNILTPILLSLELLKREISTDHGTRILTMLEDSANRGASIVKQILTFVRGSEGSREVIAINPILNEIKKIISETFPKSVRFRMFVPDDLPHISADPTQIHQVLLNLCVNARDAMPNGGLLSISADSTMLDDNFARTHIAAKPGFYLTITIKDQGTGIPPDVLSRIFEPFYTTKEVGKGTGLGLSTVFAIVKNHDGFITAVSEVGSGSTFTVYLHAETADCITGEEKKAEIVKGSGQTILIVDDEASILESTNTLLQLHGYSVVTAQNGAEAIKNYVQHQNEISLVLTDMSMPVMDGRTAIGILRKLNPTLRIVGVSGLKYQDNFQGSDNIIFLNKPYTSEQLLQVVAGVLHES